MRFTTKRLILRPFALSDAASVYQYASNPAVGDPAGWAPHTSVENSEEIIRSVLMTDETYAVCLKEDGAAIGAVGLMIGEQSELSIADDEAEIGYWIGEPFWGRGLIPEAVEELLRHAFADLSLRAVWCGFFDGNQKSERAQAKCGFRFRYTLDRVFVAPLGVYRTEHVTRITRGEWEQRLKQRRDQ